MSVSLIFRPPSIAQLWEVLSPPRETPFSFQHPGAILLFSDRLSLSLVDTVSAGMVLTGKTEDGVLFLPVPPRSFFREDLSSADRGEILVAVFQEIEKGGRSSHPPFLENCPLGLLPSGPFRPEFSDTEYLSFTSSLLAPRGDGLKSLRWEWNRFLRDHPNARLRLFSGSDRTAVCSFTAAFTDLRIRRARDYFEAEMARDMGCAFDRAIGLWEAGLIEGWIMEEERSILGLEWVGRSKDGRTLVSFLEARAEGVSNLGNVIMRRILGAAGAGVRWVNAQGGSGIGSVFRAKRMRPHDLALPLFRVMGK
jgi:hypothetical protein